MYKSGQPFVTRIRPAVKYHMALIEVRSPNIHQERDNQQWPRSEHVRPPKFDSTPVNQHPNASNRYLMRQLISRRSVPPSQVFIVATRDSRHDLVSTRAPSPRLPHPRCAVIKPENLRINTCLDSQQGDADKKEIVIQLVREFQMKSVNFRKTLPPFLLFSEGSRTPKF